MYSKCQIKQLNGIIQSVSPQVGTQKFLMVETANSIWNLQWFDTTQKDEQDIAVQMVQNLNNTILYIYFPKSGTVD